MKKDFESKLPPSGKSIEGCFSLYNGEKLVGSAAIDVSRDVVAL